MGRNLGFQQQHYADDHGMWMDTHAQQQQHNYAFHDNNSYHKQQFPASMHMMKKPYGMESDDHLSMSKHHGYGYGGMLLPNGHHGHGYGYGNNNYHMHGGGKMLGGINSSHHQFSNGGAKFNSGGGHHGYISEESSEEYEDYSEEYHHGAGKVKVDEMRYERHNWGGNGDHGFYDYPYDHMNMNMNRKPQYHGGHKVEWIAKGV